MTYAPLSGVRVLDLTNVLAGPFCCNQLAQMGAEVIKVETPGTGDLARQLGADAALNEALMGVSFLAQNAGKRSVTLNLKSDAGREVFEKLVGRADAVVENFRPGVMERLGVGFARLKDVNPRLIYCAISGFGQDGPLSRQPAYDQIVQGMSGVMSITGAADTAPYRVSYPVCDTIGGMTAAFAVAAALADRNRREAVFIDVSMLEATLAAMGWVVSDYLVAGSIPGPHGNDNITASPSGTFRTGDGDLNIAANKQEQFEALCRVIGRAELATDPRFAGRRARLDNRESLAAEIEAALISKSALQWSDLLNAAGVPAGPIFSVPEALSHPQVADRGMIGEFEDIPGVGRNVRLLSSAVRFNGKASRASGPPPRLGAHTEDLLRELGYDRVAISALREDGAI